MREPIKLAEYKEELEYIKQERAKLDMRELGAYKEIKDLFQKQVEEYLKDSFRIFKIEKDGNKTVYGIVDRIEFANWNNGKRIMSSHINLYGLFLYYDSTQDFYNATIEILKPIFEQYKKYFYGKKYCSENRFE